MYQISRHYFDSIDEKIISAEDLLQWYFNEDMEEKSFNDFIEEQMEYGDLMNLDYAAEVLQRTVDDVIGRWENECESYGIIPTSADGMRLWEEEYSNEFWTSKEVLQTIEVQIEEDMEE